MWVPKQIPYLGNFFFLHIRPKCSQTIRLQDFQINYFSRTNWWDSLFFCMLIKIPKNEKLVESFWLGMVKIGCGQSGLRTLELTLFQKWTDKVSCFFASRKLHKLKGDSNFFWEGEVGVVINGHGLLIHETLKSAVS